MDNDHLSEAFRKDQRISEVRREGGAALLGMIDQYNAARARRLGIPTDTEEEPPETSQSHEDAASEPAEPAEGQDQGQEDAPQDPVQRGRSILGEIFGAHNQGGDKEG